MDDEEETELEVRPEEPSGLLKTFSTMAVASVPARTVDRFIRETMLAIAVGWYAMQFAVPALLSDGNFTFRWVKEGWEEGGEGSYLA